MPRVNKCIELLEQGQPVFTTGAEELSYDAGRRMAQTWADMVQVDFEHHPFDTVGLQKFMRGLRDGGPTPSGHPTPAVVCTLPSNCITPEEVRYNAWQSRHVLTTGVHGILHTHARSAEAVRWFVATCRFPFQSIGGDQGIPEGLRGAGAQGESAAIWDIGTDDYVKRADPWPMNPDGELILGLKIEDRHSLADTDAIAAVPGIAFAEWGPGDMSMSHGDPNLAGHDPPYSPLMDEARNKVVASLDRAGVAFLCSWADTSMTEEENILHMIENLGAKIMHASDAEVAGAVRRRYGRTMPV